MVERIYKDEFVYWIKCTLALQKTKEGTAQYVENTMKSLIESCFGVDKEHIGRFLKKITEENKERITFKKGRGNRTWTLKSKCQSKCQKMFRIIMDKHARKNSDKLNWDFHDPSVDVSPANYWWIIAKIYMPDHNEKSIGPDQVDPLSIFSMLYHCELFVDVWDNADKIIQVRNKLMHSATYTVDESEMKNAFAKMKELLKHDKIVDTSSKAVAEIEKIEQERFFLSNITEENNEMMLRALEIKHDALEYEIKAYKSLDSEKEVKELKKILEETYQDIEERKQNEEQRKGSNLESENKDLLEKPHEMESRPKECCCEFM